MNCAQQREEREYSCPCRLDGGERERDTALKLMGHPVDPSIIMKDSDFELGKEVR